MIHSVKSLKKCLQCRRKSKMNTTIEEEIDSPLKINNLHSVEEKVIALPILEPEKIIKQETRRASMELMKIPKKEPRDPIEDEGNDEESDDAAYQCEKCDQVFKDEQQLNNHKLTHTPKNTKMNGLTLDDLRDEEIASLNSSENPTSLYFESMDTTSSPSDFYSDNRNKGLENEDSIDPFKPEQNTNGMLNEGNRSRGSTPDTDSISDDDDSRENSQTIPVSVSSNVQENGAKEPQDKAKDVQTKETDETEETEEKKNKEKVVEPSKTSSEPKLSIRPATQLLAIKPENVLKLDQSKKSTTSDNSENGFSNQYSSPMDMPLDPNSSAGLFVQANQMTPEGNHHCEVCGFRCLDAVTLEAHKLNNGHYNCNYSRACAGILFQSSSDLMAHHQTVHTAVGQLTSQVQRIQPSYQPTRSSQPNYSNMLQHSMRQQGNVRPNNAMMQQRKRTALPQPVQQPIRSTPPKRRCDVNSERIIQRKSVDSGPTDVLSQLSKSITTSVRQSQPKKPSVGDSAAVASILFNRGLTVSSIGPAKTPQKQTAQNLLPISLNSAVSLIPTNAKPNSNSPSNRLPTVDLTGPDVPRGGVRRLRTATCDICDKTFFSEDVLNQHMATHRNPRKQGISRETSLTALSSSQDMVIPIVDLKQPGATSRLNALGINYAIPLSALGGAQSSGGSFSIPILSVGSRNSSINLAGVGASSALPLGPLMSISKSKF